VYLNTQPKVLAKLTEELKKAVQNPTKLPSWATLEQLPYLTAVVMESIRLSYGVATRLARIAPDEVLVYEGAFRKPGSSKETPVRYAIPKGTPIGMSSALMNVHPDIFPEPHAFIPERWLNDDGSRRSNLEPYLLSFSKGSRQCLGMK
jgi:cytochrome P450